MYSPKYSSYAALLLYALNLDVHMETQYIRNGFSCFDPRMHAFAYSTEKENPPFVHRLLNWK